MCVCLHAGSLITEQLSVAQCNRAAVDSISVSTSQSSWSVPVNIIKFTVILLQKANINYVCYLRQPLWVPGVSRDDFLKPLETVVDGWFIQCCREQKRKCALLSRTDRSHETGTSWVSLENGACSEVMSRWGGWGVKSSSKESHNSIIVP